MTRANPVTRAAAWAAAAAAMGAALVGTTARGADVTYTGPAVGNWNVAGNWSGGAVPADASFNVTIGSGKAVTFNRAGTTTINNLALSAYNASLYLGGGSNLTVAGNFTGDGTVMAAGGAFRVNGAVNANGSGWYADNGGSITLGGLTSYVQDEAYTNRYFRARNAGSVVSMTNLTSVGVNATSAVLTLGAESGGTLDLRKVNTVTLAPNNSLDVYASGAGSVVNLSALASLPTARVSIDVSNGGTLLWGNPTTLKGAQFSVSGASSVVATSSLANVDNSTFTAAGGATLHVPVAAYGITTDYTSTDFFADGTGSRVRVTNLTSVNLAGYNAVLELRARGGGRVDATQLTAVTMVPSANFDVLSEGAGSVVDLSSLSLLPTNGVTVDVRNGGTVLWGAPAALKNGTIASTGTGNTLNTASLTNLDGTTLTAFSGAVLTFGGVTGANMAVSASDTWRADGAGSRIALTNLASVAATPDYTHLVVHASGAGVVDLKNLTTAQVMGVNADIELRAVGGGAVDVRNLATIQIAKNSGLFKFYADGAGSTINASALNLLPTAGVSIDLRNGAALQWANPTALRDGSLSLTGAGNAINLSALSNVNDSNLFAYSGANLTLGAVTSYGTLKSYGTRYLHGEGAGSTVALTNLASLTIGHEYAYINVEAEAGGKVDLRNVTNVGVSGVNAQLQVSAESGGTVDLRNLSTVSLSPDSARLVFYATGAGSTINVSALSNLPTNGVSVDLRNGGAVQWGNPTAFRGGEIKFTGAGNALNVGAMTNVDDSSFYAFTGATLTLPVTAYAVNRSYAHKDFHADGAGAVLNLTNVASVQVKDDYSSLQVFGDEGGRVDLRNLTSVSIGGINGVFEVSARAGGRVDVSKLANLTIAPTGELRFYADGANSVIDASALTNLPANAVSLDIRNGGALLWNNPTALRGGSISLTGTNNTVALASLADIDNTKLFAEKGAVLALSVPGYAVDKDYAGPTWTAEGAGTRMTLTSLASIDLKGAYTHLDVTAKSGSTIDLKSLATASRGTTGSTLDFVATGAGSLVDAPQFQNGFYAGLPLPGGISPATSISATNGGTFRVKEVAHLPLMDVYGASSRAYVDGTLSVPDKGTLRVGPDATLHVKRDFFVSGTSEANVNTPAGVLAVDGSGLQRVEVGGNDAGSNIAAVTNDNFGFGRLVVGNATSVATIAELRDDLNNGNRGASGSEALYLFGARGRTTAPQGADPATLNILNGSTLLIGDQNVYVRSATGVVNLQSLIPAGQRMVAYGGGYVSRSISAVPGAWNTAGNGNWSTTGNWLITKPGGAGTQAVFGDKVTGAATVNVDAPVTVGLLAFDGPGAYAVNGNNAITLQNAGGLRAGVHVRGGATGGNHVVNAPITLAADLDLVSYSSGLLTIAGPLNNPGARFIAKSGTGTIALAGAQNHAAGAIIAAGEGTLRLDSDVAGGAGGPRNVTLRSVGGTLHVNASQHVKRVEAVGGRLSVDGAGANRPVLVTNELFIGDGGLVEFGRGAMVIDYAPGQSPAAAVRAALRRGFNGPGGPWSGTNGIRSTLEYGVGYGEASRLLGASGGSFFGEQVDGTSILLRYTKPGDANLDGVVNFNDLVLLAQNYNTGSGADPLPWDKGDFNYDGYVDFVDLVSIAQYYNKPVDPSGGAGFGAAFAGEWARAIANGGAAVPEPAGLATLAMAGGAWALRRRRRVSR